MDKKLDSAKTLVTHTEIINRKPFLKKIYLDFYNRLKINKIKGKIVELGSGANLTKRIYPEIITSDVIKGEGIDLVFSAEQMPFKNNSIEGIIMIDTLHHIKNPEKSLNEMNRVLKNGGKIMMIEPYNSLWGRFIYQNFHHEDFNPNAGWKIKGEGRLTDANGAIPWIIFVRDKDVFIRKFPKLRIIKVEPHTPFRYLLSGGLSKPQFVPNFFYNFINSIENLLNPLNKFLGMFVTIELEKIK